MSVFNNISYKTSMLKIKKLFPMAFITMRDELILDRDSNLYFRLEDINSNLDFKCKMIAWLSRPISKGIWNSIKRQALLDLFNEFLGTCFTMKDMEEIYTYLGNDINRKRCEKFIESGYNMKVLRWEDADV